jgi:hypothetical protein
MGTRVQSQNRAVAPPLVPAIISAEGKRKNGNLVRSSPAVKKRTRARTATAPANRCSALGARKCQLERGITHDVRRSSPEDQPGTESALGKAKGLRSEAKADDLDGGTQTDRSGAESKVGKGEEGDVGKSRAVMPAAPGSSGRSSG